MRKMGVFFRDELVGYTGVVGNVVSGGNGRVLKEAGGNNFGVGRLRSRMIMEWMN